MSLFKFLNESLCKLLALSFSFPMYIHHKVLSSVTTGLELFNRTDLQTPHAFFQWIYNWNISKILL